MPDTVNRNLNYAVHVDARNVNVVRLQLSRRHHVVFHLHDGYGGSHGHDGVEVALGQPSLTVADGVGLPGADEGVISGKWVFQHVGASVDLPVLFAFGQLAQATVPIGGVVTGIAVPNEAILDDNGTPVAYVQTGGETFVRRILTLGERDGIRTQVLAGLSLGEMVVTVGAYQVRLASLAGGDFAGGHAH